MWLGIGSRGVVLFRRVHTMLGPFLPSSMELVRVQFFGEAASNPGTPASIYNEMVCYSSQHQHPGYSRHGNGPVSIPRDVSNNPPY